MLMGALPTGMFPLLQRPDKSKAAKAKAREALALPEEVQEQVELQSQQEIYLLVGKLEAVPLEEHYLLAL